jgi:hypothetical protein
VSQYRSIVVLNGRDVLPQQQTTPGQRDAPQGGAAVSEGIDLGM